MSQNFNNQNGITDEAKRLQLLGYSFSVISFIVFVYILFFPVEKELKQQAIYWFASSFVVAIIPSVKQFKIKDIEVQLQDISRKVEDNKNLIEQRTEELKDDLFLSLESVRKREESLSEEYKLKRELRYKNYAERLDKLTPEEKLKEQKKATLFYLIKTDNMTVSKLKKMLQKLDLYHGAIDAVFDESLAQSISNFQQKYKVTPIDGIAGFKTLSKLSEIIEQMSETKK